MLDPVTKQGLVGTREPTAALGERIVEGGERVGAGQVGPDAGDAGARWKLSPVGIRGTVSGR